MSTENTGEFELIRRLIKHFPPCNESELTGIGDDCAVIGTLSDRLLVTTDLLAEDVHFVLHDADPYILGRKALAVNLSDIAAMGGIPRWFFVSIAIPRNMDFNVIDRMYAGMAESAARHEVILLGGDTTSSRSGLVINICVLGDTFGCPPVHRHGAKPGDRIQISGAPGRSAAGLHMILNRYPVNRFPSLYAAHTDPEPQVNLGRKLAETRRITAMIDLSDGLLQDLGHICEESGCGGRIDLTSIPLDSELLDYTDTAGLDLHQLILGGGEDYLLCWTVSPEHAEEVLETARRAGSEDACTIGAVTDSNGVDVYRHGQLLSVPHRGWDHFRSP